MSKSHGYWEDESDLFFPIKFESQVKTFFDHLIHEQEFTHSAFGDIPLCVEERKWGIAVFFKISDVGFHLEAIQAFIFWLI